LATLVAFVHCLEATAQDEALEVLEMLLHDPFGHATQAYTKARLRTLIGPGPSRDRLGQGMPALA
jgi:hypothetical protein